MVGHIDELKEGVVGEAGEGKTRSATAPYRFDGRLTRVTGGGVDGSCVVLGHCDVCFGSLDGRELIDQYSKCKTLQDTTSSGRGTTSSPR